MKEIIELIKTIPSEAIVIIATALITSTITLISVWLTNSASNKRLKIQFQNEKDIKKEELIRSNLEELYIISNKYLDTLFTYYLPYRSVMEGKITFNEALDITIASKVDYDLHRIRMLINMYFPELKSKFNQIIDIRDKLNLIVSGYKEQYKTGDFDGSKWLQKFQPLYKQITELVDKFDENIVELKT